MANSVYTINKGINKSIEFKGLKAQYIWYLGGGIVMVMALFGILYAIGVSQYICLIVAFAAGGVMVMKIFQLSNKYGEHGMMKMMAKRSVPKLVRSSSRSGFIKLKSSNHAK
ncbi:hypothetical protein DBR11_11460 [Pedobacter sp. HMWF019]|uniref:DUF4133 domain-containing protein n=1 Tax=Pedobacter sp. HMWF019 TaxID=2056856 RepID=UPI000D337DC6|nr:DUF4133 domain-containing protein [Pedobacter sp. HMWF019]PTS99883.1 hypothetical protein DBR11_11460 [Pedobacter sp. HMWF019]